MTSESKYWDSSFSEGVHVENGVPVRFFSLRSPYSRAEEPALAERIRQLTGWHVRFGNWIKLEGDPRDGGSEVTLFVDAE